ncbi:hypothetical protein JJL50_13190 [Stenotrophomonas maltophilia]|jgi:hypothetical protein|uniref:Phage tail assembly chaperone n=1 Tax=Stenotrophomonas maltophilia TaxID=40324 RepID=A0ABD7C0B1_STEMA|nr:hypothetical protein [Stenotrophomonas maltophilia]QQQ40910.1 hypothetical protein JJL50_13190 [Stenotrophomonas maltophilia]
MSKTSETTDTQPQQPVSILQSFTDLGMFASKDVHADAITLPNGDKARFHVRELPDAEFRKLWGEGDRAKLIAATICDEDGKPVMNVTQAAQLKPLVAAELQRVAMKHSGFGDDAAQAQADAGNG